MLPLTLQREQAIALVDDFTLVQHTEWILAIMEVIGFVIIVADDRY